MDSNDQQSQMIEGLEYLRFKLHDDDLSLGNFRILCKFLFNLINARSSNKVKLVYRGESFDNLKSKLKMHGVSPDYRKLNDFLFLIGEKGRSYRKEYREKVKDKGKLFGINNTSIEFFEYIQKE